MQFNRDTSFYCPGNMENSNECFVYMDGPWEKVHQWNIFDGQPEIYIRRTCYGNAMNRICICNRCILTVNKQNLFDVQPFGADRLIGYAVGDTEPCKLAVIIAGRQKLDTKRG